MTELGARRHAHRVPRLGRPCWVVVIFALDDARRLARPVLPGSARRPRARRPRSDGVQSPPSSPTFSAARPPGSPAAAPDWAARWRCASRRWARGRAVGRARQPPLEAVVAEIDAAGGRAASAPCDVRDAEAGRCRARPHRRESWAFPTSSSTTPRATSSARSEDLTPNGFAAVVGIVLHGTFHCTRAAGEALDRGEARRRGPVASRRPTPTTGSAFVLPSACAKAGVVALTRSLAVEWARHGIRLNAIAPGTDPDRGRVLAAAPDRRARSEREAPHPRRPLRHAGRARRARGVPRLRRVRLDARRGRDVRRRRVAARRRRVQRPPRRSPRDDRGPEKIAVARPTSCCVSSGSGAAAADPAECPARLPPPPRA